MPEFQNISVEDGIIKYARRSFMLAGEDVFTDPPAQDPDSFNQLDNVTPGVRPRLIRRWGTTRFDDATPMRVTARRIYETHFTNGRNRFILAASDSSGGAGNNNRVVATNENGNFVTTTDIFVPSAGAAHPEISTSRNFVYFSDGITADLLKWDTDDDPSTTGSVTKWGIAGPTTAPTLAAGGGTNVTISAAGRSYCYAYRNSATGHTSDISPFASIADLTNSAVTISNLTASTDPQVDQIVVMTTTDGGAQDTLYEVAIISNGTTSTIDDIGEEDLADKELWNELDADGRGVGVIGNTPVFEVAPDATISCMHRGHCYILEGHHLFWSKTLHEVTTSTGNVTGKWEEAIPIQNQTSLSSDGAEVGRSLQSDGINLYIGTNRNVYALSGDDPGLNPPRALFNEVGVLNNAVWKIVYHAGQAVGAVWMTPDHRVILSNLSTYQDVGRPLQTTWDALGNITTTATATFMAYGQNEFYILAPGLVSDGSVAFTRWFNVTTGRWTTYFSKIGDPLNGPLEPVYAVSYMLDTINQRPLPIYSTDSNRYNRWDPTTVYDHNGEGDQTLPGPAIVTNWLDFGDSTVTKTLHSVEIQTGEASLQLTLQGATNEDDFQSPVTIVSGRAFTENLFGNLWCPVADLNTNYRFFRIALTNFAGTDVDSDFLSYLSFEYTPLASL